MIVSEAPADLPPVKTTAANKPNSRREIVSPADYYGDIMELGIGVAPLESISNQQEFQQLYLIDTSSSKDQLQEP